MGRVCIVTQRQTRCELKNKINGILYRLKCVNKIVKRLRHEKLS